MDLFGFDLPTHIITSGIVTGEIHQGKMQVT
jgi:hypothetical protein